MNKYEILEKLKAVNSISYWNGQRLDKIHPGAILAQYVEMEVGSKAYQEFNVLLNDCLTLVGCDDLIKIKEFDNYSAFYLLLKPFFEEAIILKEFESLVELIQLELTSIVNEKTKITNAVIAHIINNLAATDSRIKSINKDKTEKFIQDLVLAKLNLRSKTASQLANFNISGSNKDILTKQVSDTIIANFDALT